MLVACGANASDLGRVGTLNGINFHKFDGISHAVSIHPGLIPGTTLLEYMIYGDTQHKSCMFLVKGVVENQKDIDALKLEKVVQMSCTPEQVVTKTIE